MSTSSQTDVVSQLRALGTGRVISPGDPDYDAARTVFYGGLDRRPAAIVRVSDAREVSRVVTFAREAGLALAIRSGGHSLAGHGVCDGIVLDLSEMRGMDLDVERRTAWVQPGLTTGAYAEAAAAHGLATGFGDAGTVGIGGITVGGGIGFLVRKYGLTIDDLLAAEVVTADGEVRHVDAETHPDLFWAIRGGGGNFGVVTRLQLRLHELPSIVGGMLFLPATAETLHRFVELSIAAPEELSTIANVMNAPPMPFVPAEFHGRLVIMAFICYAGATEPGERAIAPFRALATPLLDTVKTCAYTEMFPPHPEDYHPTATNRTMYVDAVDRELTETIVKFLPTSTAQMSVAQVRVLGGAAARVPADATAYAHRARPILVNVAAVYATRDEAPGHAQWLDEFVAAINPPDRSAYVNFIGREGAARVRDAYPPATWARLQSIKRKYDPANLFRVNQNIPPA